MRVHALFVLAAFCAAAAQLPGQTVPDSVRAKANVVRPSREPATEERIRQLKLSPGFEIQVFADGLGSPRMLAVASDGAVYVTRRRSDDCLMLKDANRDGRADQRSVVAREPGLHGIALDGNRAYFASVREVFVADRQADGSLGPLRTILQGLPEAGQHPNRTLGIGPDRMLYITVGSTCNACIENSPESATILRAPLSGGKREIYSSGLRNTVGFAWHPDTGELWGVDNGTDWLGDKEPPEELNRLVQGAKYGWPFVTGKGVPFPFLSPPGGKTAEEWARESRDPVLTYTAHAAPLQMAFYTGRQFPAGYAGDAFVAMHGSWNRNPPSGYEVVRIRFQNGKPVAMESFLTGFLIQVSGGWRHFGRPAGIAVTPDGALLVSDDSNGIIYRISYRANR